MTGARCFGTFAPATHSRLMEFTVNVVAFVERNMSASLLMAKKINCTIGRYFHKPSAELVSFNFRPGKLVEFGKGFQERLLTNIFGILGTSGEAAGYSLQPWSMRRHQSGEGVPVTSASCRQRDLCPVRLGLQWRCICTHAQR